MESRVNFQSFTFRTWSFDESERARITWACPSVNKIYQWKRFSETFAPTSKADSRLAEPRLPLECFSIGNISLRRTHRDIRNSQCILFRIGYNQRERSRSCSPGRLVGLARSRFQWGIQICRERIEVAKGLQQRTRDVGGR